MTDNKINTDAIAEFLTLGFVLGDHTFISGEKARRMIELPSFETNRKSTINTVKESLLNSIERGIKGKGRIAYHLSGGKDTRLVCALVKSLGIDVTAVTFGEEGCVDVKIAKKVAEKLKIPHQVITVTPADFSLDKICETVEAVDGLISFTYFHSGYQLNKKLFPDFDVVLSGALMTEIMDSWGFISYPKDPLEAMKKRWVYSKIVKEKVRTKVDQKLRKMYGHSSLEEIIFDTTVKNVFLKGLDAFSIKGCNVYPVVIDKEALSNIYSLPFSKRRATFLSKQILRNLYPDLLNIPHSYSGYMIPLSLPYIIHRSARVIHTRGQRKFFGICDLDNQLRYTLRDFIENSINSMELGIIDQSLVKQSMREHFSGIKYHTVSLGRVTTVKIWLDQFNNTPVINPQTLV